MNFQCFFSFSLSLSLCIFISERVRGVAVLNSHIMSWVLYCQTPVADDPHAEFKSKVREHILVISPHMGAISAFFIAYIISMVV